MMVTSFVKRSGRRARVRSKSRKWLAVALVLFGTVLLASGATWFPWHRIGSFSAVTAEAAIAEPPVVELTGIDPAVVRAIEKARAAVKQSPRSFEAWGVLGKTLLVHDFHIPASFCLAQAERLDPANARWP